VVENEDIKQLTPDELNQLLVESVPYPIEVFPDGFRQVIEETTEYFQTEPGITGTVAMTVLSNSIGNTALCWFKGGYSVKPFLWSAIIEPTGFCKTPLINKLTEGVEHEQGKAHSEFQEAIEVYKKDVKVYEFKQKEELRKKKGKLFEIDIDAMFALPEPKIPTLKQYISKDFTFEALVPVFCENPKGILIIKDEMSGLINSLNQYKQGKGSDRDNLLELFNCGSLKVDRKGKDGKPVTLYAPKSGAAVLGGIQPARMSRIFQTDSFDDGLLPRFLMVRNTKDTLPQSTLLELSKEVEEYWQELINHCLKIEFCDNETTKYYLDKGAQVYHNAWINDANALYPALSEKARVFIPKLHLYALKFALLLKAIYNFENETEDRRITVDDMQKTHKLTEYYLSQVIQVCKLYGNDGSKKLDFSDMILLEILADEFKSTEEDKILLNDVAVKYFARIKPGGALKDKNRDKFNKSVAAKIRGYGLEAKAGTGNRVYVYRNDKQLNKMLQETG